jgi:hypothetical protein
MVRPGLKGEGMIIAVGIFLVVPIVIDVDGKAQQGVAG